MVSVPDIVREVERLSAASLDDLEEALHAETDLFLPALDACIDHGFLRLVVRRDPFLATPYRVTARGRRLLAASRRAAAAS